MTDLPMWRYTNIRQGEADIQLLSGRIIGYVTRVYGTGREAGWYARGSKYRVSLDPWHKRDCAARELVQIYAKTGEV